MSLNNPNFLVKKPYSIKYENNKQKTTKTYMFKMLFLLIVLDRFLDQTVQFISVFNNGRGQLRKNVPLFLFRTSIEKKLSFKSGICIYIYIRFRIPKHIIRSHIFTWHGWKINRKSFSVSRLHSSLEDLMCFFMTENLFII